MSRYQVFGRRAIYMPITIIYGAWQSPGCATDVAFGAPRQLGPVERRDTRVHPRDCSLMTMPSSGCSVHDTIRAWTGGVDRCTDTRRVAFQAARMWICRG